MDEIIDQPRKRGQKKKLLCKLLSHWIYSQLINSLVVKIHTSLADNIIISIFRAVIFSPSDINKKQNASLIIEPLVEVQETKDVSFLNLLSK